MISKIEKILLTFIGSLMLIVLMLSATEHHIVQNSRDEESYEVVEHLTYEQYEETHTPIGIVNEYRFRLGDVTSADSLVFCASHQNIEVFIDEVCVTRAKENGKIVHTNATLWEMITLQREDSGKEVCVKLYPLYENYQDEQVTFMIGSELEIYREMLYKAAPEIVLSICVVMTGIFLLGIAFYYASKGMGAAWLYAIGMLAISAGIWRFTYGTFVYLLFPDHTVFIYTLSIISLMVIAFSTLI